MPPPVLEIELRSRDAASYVARFRFVPPDSAVPVEGEFSPVRFDPEPLAAAAAVPARYGLELGKSLLGEAALRDVFTQARAAAGGGGLRIRLGIDSESRRLHRLRWETLC